MHAQMQLIEPDTLGVRGPLGGRGPGGFRRPLGKSPVALDTQEGDPSVIEYPGPMPRDAEVESTEFVTMTGDTGESVHRENVSGVTLALPGACTAS